MSSSHTLKGLSTLLVGPVGLEPTTYGLKIWPLARTNVTCHYLADFPTVKGENGVPDRSKLINVCRDLAAFLVPKLCPDVVACRGGTTRSCARHRRDCPYLPGTQWV